MRLKFELYKIYLTYVCGCSVPSAHFAYLTFVKHLFFVITHEDKVFDVKRASRCLNTREHFNIKNVSQNESFAAFLTHAHTHALTVITIKELIS